MDRSLKPAGADRPPPPGGTVRIGAFVFDPSSGELRGEGPDGPAVQRLGPKPARLLAMLIEHDGALVGHRAIQQALWPEVRVDFDQGLHFCVRQVRAALGDSATAPRYVENLPRRGYRLMVPVEPLDDDRPGRPADEPAAAARRGRRLAVAGVLALVAVAAAVTLSRGRSALEAPAPPLRLAILPFVPPAEAGAEAVVTPIAELLLLTLGQAPVAEIGVIGPTTTGVYGGAPDGYRALVAAIEVDYVIHGRYLAGGDGGDPPRLLGELIRAADGRHVWVAAFDDLDAWQTIADTVACGVATELELSIAAAACGP